jgi:sulfide:quinone oxidoreductase
MPEIRQIAPAFAVAGQLRPEELTDIAALGFRTIVNNRPDGEEPGQPSSADLAAEAGRLGLSYTDLPAQPGQITDEQARALAQALEVLPVPVLAFCRSGRRSAALWALAEARRGDPDAILAALRAAGYDLEMLQPRLSALAGAAAR